jgi:hypothetical protein
MSRWGNLDILVRPRRWRGETSAWLPTTVPDLTVGASWFGPRSHGGGGLQVSGYHSFATAASSPFGVAGVYEYTLRVDPAGTRKLADLVGVRHPWQLPAALAGLGTEVVDRGEQRWLTERVDEAHLDLWTRLHPADDEPPDPSSAHSPSADPPPEPVQE